MKVEINLAVKVRHTNRTISFRGEYELYQTSESDVDHDTGWEIYNTIRGEMKGLGTRGVSSSDDPPKELSKLRKEMLDEPRTQD